MDSVLKVLRPTIDYAVSSVNGASDPLIKNKARILAAKAIQSYNPASGAQLHTWVSQQLLPLRRFRRQTQMAIDVPERIQLEAYTLSAREKEFTDKYDREPDMEELADYANIPIKRIQKIRSVFKKAPSEAELAASAESPDFTLNNDTTDYAREALDYVYGDSDYIDRKILELKTGFNGLDPIAPKDIAIKLSLSPAQLSRRSARLAFRIQEIENQLQHV